MRTFPAPAAAAAPVAEAAATAATAADAAALAVAGAAHARSQRLALQPKLLTACCVHAGAAQFLQQIVTIIRRARPLVEAIERRDRDLCGQLKRSLNSTALNLAEAFGVRAGNARLSFRRAQGELYESQATFQVAAAWGYITEQQAQAAQSDLAALGGRLYGLSRR